MDKETCFPKKNNDYEWRNEELKNRFWEFYLVRYLAGTLFGVIILLLLFYNYNTAISNSFFFASVPKNVQTQVSEFLFNSTYEFNGVEVEKIGIDTKNQVTIESNGALSGNQRIKVTKSEVTWLSIVVITVAGFLFMYISSALILIIHTFRFCFFCCVGKHNKARYYKNYMILARTRALAEKKTGDKERGSKKAKIYSDKDWVGEYVESYRHLREHGNAFGILISEIIFAALLVWSNFCIIVIILWITMGFVSWWVATYMEVKLIKKHEGLLE